MTLVPGGAKGISLKSKFPSIVACAEIFGLRIEGPGMFNVICVCYMSLYHRCIGNILSVPLRNETK